MDNGITPLKKCIKCGQEKPPTSEYFPVRNTGQLRGECRACKSAREKEYYLEIREHKREYDREYYREHREKIISDARQYYAENTERVKARIYRWQLANPEKRRIYGIRQRVRHPETYRAKNHRRRALKRNAPGSFTVEDIQRQYELQNGKCFWCFKKLRRKFEIDHYTPLSRGGTNYADNIVCSCQRCNRSRNNRLPHEWGRLF